MATMKQAGLLLNRFEKGWKQRYGRPFVGNRAADIWGFREIIEDLGYDGAKALVDYFFKLSHPDHNRKWFIYHYDEVYQRMLDVEADKRQQRELLRKTKELVESYESE